MISALKKIKALPILSKTQEVEWSSPFSGYQLVLINVCFNQSFLNTVNFFSVSTVHFLMTEVVSHHSVKSK